MTTAAKPPATEVARRLTAAQAEEQFGKQPGQVWDEDLQQFVALGQALVIEQMGKPIDLAKNLEAFQANRKVVLRFIKSEYFEESKYTEKGYPLAGQLGDYYKVPGSEQMALTKRGASKIKQLFRWARGATRHVTGEQTKDYCSATIEVPILDHFGRTVGAGIGSCSTAEKGFTSENAIRKYGGRVEKGVVTVPPDYRGALHDVVSRATKRADTQATIVAASLEEIFTAASEDEPKGKDEEPGAPAPVYPGDAPTFRFPTAINTPAFKHLAGKPIRDVTTEDLTKLAEWCRTTKAKNPAALATMAAAVAEDLERRRVDAEEAVL